MQSLEQQRMKKAYKYACIAKGEEKIESKYATLAKKLPSMIVHNGLITTIAFLRSKEKNEEDATKLLLSQLIEYLSKELKTENNYDAVIAKLHNIDLIDYIRISNEMIAFSTWLKRIAEGELENEE